MIINCINCKKKFEVNSSLIPEKGRSIQCGACNHVWFYKPEIDILMDETNSKIVNTLVEKNEKIIEKKIPQNQEVILSDDIEVNNKLIDKKIKKKDKKNLFSIIKFFSYIVVLIISFIAVIIILDTFKSPLSVIFPELEIFLYNLFETVKDIYLFLKNLLN
tara:strand:+ start:91 stop:573 length:483 start_codon:yes stop_codon:yes gene_type:complete